MKKTLISVISTFILSVSAAHADENAICKNPLIRIAGQREVVYNYKTDHCNRVDVPDTPAMAFKDAHGKVHLFNGITGSFASVGSSLNDVHRDCDQSLSTDDQPENKATPASFDNWKWFRSPWTNDGKTVYGLIHNEFHGWEKPDQYCPSGKENPCLYPNVTASISTDGGKTFRALKDSKGQVVLALVTPYAYNKDANKQAGIRAPTNIISKQENGKTYYFLLASNRGAKGIAQKGGTCLYRSDDVTDPSHWRAWDGKGFNVVVNATVYRQKDLDPTQHICKPVFGQPPSSWTYNTVLKEYVAIVGTKDSGDQSFAYVTSKGKDMTHWSKPKTLMQTTFAQFHASRKGSGVSGQTYPSLLDPTSPGMNFEYSGAHPYLYFTRFNPKVKHGDWHNRDLIRVPLEVSCGN